MLWLQGPGESLFRRFLHAVPLRLGPAGAPWLAAPWPCLSCSCACCRGLATRPWRVVLMGFEGTVRHPASLNFRLFLAALALAATGPFSVAFCTPCHCAWVQRGAPWLAAPWLCLSCSCASCGALAGLLTGLPSSSLPGLATPPYGYFMRLPELAIPGARTVARSASCAQL